jgi:hypothetical protein
LATAAQLTVQLAALAARVAALEASVKAQNTNLDDLANEIIDIRALLEPETYRVMQGTYMSAVPWDTAAWDAYEAAAGKKQSIIHYGQSWWTNGAYRPFYPNVIEMCRARGGIPLIDWSPWDTAVAPVYTQPRFSLAAIARGDHDTYIRSYAAAAASWGKPVMLRPMHEMNGTWYPWSETQNGNSSGQYVQAWQHIVTLFRAVGATNVTWCWCVNKLYPGSIPLAGLYPGDDYVDWVGIDAYSGGVKFPDEPFAQMLGPTYDAVGALTSKPIILAEWGYALAAKRPAWLKDALASVFNFPRLRAICYFMWSSDDAWDFRADAASMAAWREGLANPRYAAAEFATLAGKVTA